MPNSYILPWIAENNELKMEFSNNSIFLVISLSLTFFYHKSQFLLTEKLISKILFPLQATKVMSDYAPHASSSLMPYV